MLTKEKKSLLINSAVRSLHWVLINSLFGLSPIILGFGLSLIFLSISFSITEIIASGAVLFFCATITGSAMVDYILSDYRFSKIIDSNLYFIPLSIVFFAAVLFVQLSFRPEAKPNIDILLKTQNFIIFVTFMYCFILKTVLFIKK
jgi:hypothetical protein